VKGVLKVICHRNRDLLADFLDTSSIMGGVDFHLHSTYSDGAETPFEVVATVVENGLKAFALTDHDTMAGTGEIVEALTQLGQSSQCEEHGNSTDNLPLFVPGIEFSVMQDDCEIHILGYFTEYDPPGLSVYIEEQAKSRERRNHAMLEKLRSLGYDIRLDDLMHYGEEHTLPGRVHMALWLVEHGFFRSVNHAFQELLGVGKPAFIPRTRRSVGETCREIARAGGLSVIAHPHLYGWTDNPELSSTREKLRERIVQLAEEGLTGIECFHGKATPEEQRLLADIASEFGMIRTAGSDCHGRTDHHAPMYDRYTSFTHLI
jgi:predicted metal-dependent phosphoesterase TrpH